MHLESKEEMIKEDGRIMKVDLLVHYQEASRKLKEKYGLLIQPLNISYRLSSKITTPYKGRFMFYYATDEEVKKYLEDNKVS